jgi:hypothetical protein
MADNPFAVLTAVVAPAILTNACSVLSLGTANRLGRVVDRSRALTNELETMVAGDPHYHWLLSQLDRQRVRAAMLLRALRVFYLSLGSFAAAALLSVVGSVLTVYGNDFAYLAVAAAALVVGTFGVTCLVIACGLMVQETRLAVRTMEEEADQVRSRFPNAV